MSDRRQLTATRRSKPSFSAVCPPRIIRSPQDTTVAVGPGTRLVAYEILSLIGSGGMGEVYRSRDRKLDRDVAIKVLPDSLAGDAERLARFEREAKTLAALNHPNIAHIHGFEDSGGTPALVMELVEGPTLADRIAKGARSRSMKHCRPRSRSPTHSKPPMSRGSSTVI